MAKGKNVVKFLNRKIKTETAVIILLYAIAIIVSLTLYTINRSLYKKEKLYSAEEGTDYIINLKDRDVIYKDNIEASLDINDYKKENSYKIIIKLNNNVIIESENLDKENKFNIKLDKEGKKELDITIYVNNEKKYNKIFYI